MSTPRAGRDGFPTTRWTLVRSAAAGTQARRHALEELLSIYWVPLYHYARRKGLDRDRAQDAVQGLCLRLVEGDAIERLDPGKGRLRGYLKRSLDHHLVNLHEHRSARKRGGDAVVLPLDTEFAERTLAGAPDDPGRACDRRWAASVMERALERLAAEFARGERRGPFEAVQLFFRGDDAPPSYEEVARRFGLSVPQLKSLLHRSRGRFRELVLEVVADTVATPEEAEAEMRALLDALAS